MQQDNSTIRDKALEWFWNKNTYIARNRIANKYFPNKNRSLDDEEIESCYLSEHPTETIKEVADLSTGFTGGKWYLADDRPNGWILSSDIIINDKHPVIVVFDKSKEDTANATRIVTCVNNFDALVSALKEVTKEYEYAMKLLAEAGGFTYSENNVSISAKAILNRIDNPTK